MEDASKFIFIIVFLLIAGIRWLLENVGKKKENSREHWEEYDYPERADTVTRQPNSLEDLYEEARREILSRQNRQVPTPEEMRAKLAPPPLPPPARPARKPVTPSRPPALAPTPEKKKRTLTAAEKAAVENFQKHSRIKKSQETDSGQRIRQLLSNPSSARDAVILAEILGPRKI